MVIAVCSTLICGFLSFSLSNMCFVNVLLKCRCFSFLNFFSSSGKPFDRPYNYDKNEKYINGLTEYELKLVEHIPLEKSTIFKRTERIQGHYTELEFEQLRPGSVVAIA